MNLVSKLRWALIATSLVSGSALAAIVNCDVTPRNSVIADGETLQLAATCTGGSLSSIELLMNGTSVSGSINLSNHVAGEAVYFTSPVGLASSGAVFTVDGTPASLSDSFGSSTAAKVVVKSAAGSVVAAPTGFATTSAIAASCGTADGMTVSSLPTGPAQCATGSTPSLVVSAPTFYSWSCLSTTGGAEANCYAARGVTYTVTANDGNSPYGNVSPATQQVAGGSSATVTATPNTGYNTSWSSTCGGTPSGNLYTTNALSGPCVVTASFSTAPAVVNGSCGSSDGGTFSVAPTTSLCSAGTASSVATGTSAYTWSCAGSNGGTTASCSATRTVAPPPPVGDDPGVGSGLWAPGGSTTRTVADPSGPELNRIVSYVPGCLNGLTANNSATGCAALSSYTGTLAGTTTSRTVSLVSGKELLLRYRPKANAGTSVKGIYVSSATGGSVGPSMKVWLSTDPTATYDSVPAVCKNTSTSFPSVTTGPGYCPISTSNPVYYFGFETSSTTPLRFKVQESQSDLY